MKTIPWRLAEALKGPEDHAAYLEAAIESGDADEVAAAIHDLSVFIDIQAMSERLDAVGAVARRAKSIATTLPQ